MQSELPVADPATTAFRAGIRSIAAVPDKSERRRGGRLGSGWLIRLLIGGWLAAVWVGGAHAGTLAQLRTVFGDMEIELLDRDKPATVRNFIRYVESSRWQDMFAHRCVTNFVLQGGGYRVLNAGTDQAAIVGVESFGTISNEFSLGERWSNLKGTLAMAKLAGDTNSASSEWFLNLQDNPLLDREDTTNLFTVFGHIIRGTNVLEVFNHFSRVGPTNVIVDLRLALGHPAFGELPLLSTNITFDDLIYVDVSLLRVQVDSAPAGTQISWNSVRDLDQVVEFTRSLPPSWELLVRTNGNGERMTVSDPQSGQPLRFYRVRVDP